MFFKQTVEFCEHIPVVSTVLDREHSGGVTDTEHSFAGEFVMHVACERVKISDALYMLLAVQYRLIIVRYAPAHRYIEVEQLAELICGCLGIGVSPGSEGNEELAIFVKCEITVHHRRDTDGRDLGEIFTVFLFVIGC